MRSEEGKFIVQTLRSDESDGFEIGWAGQQGKDRGGTLFDWGKWEGDGMVTSLRSLDQHANTFSNMLRRSRGTGSTVHLPI